jgi:ferritin-like metal-binding protein YciE
MSFATRPFPFGFSWLDCREIADLAPYRSQTMNIESLDDLFLHTLKDVLYAERIILKALPKMERKATDAKLKAALSTHLSETEDQVARLEEVFEILGKPARGAKCDAMVGLIDEAEGLMADVSDTDTMDAALISLAQAVEHYEIARYGTLVAWAKQLGQPQAAVLLKATLDEEYGADKALSKLAEHRLNAAAMA